MRALMSPFDVARARACVCELLDMDVMQCTAFHLQSHNRLADGRTGSQYKLASPFGAAIGSWADGTRSRRSRGATAMFIDALRITQWLIDYVCANYVDSRHVQVDRLLVPIFLSLASAVLVPLFICSRFTFFNAAVAVENNVALFGGRAVIHLLF